MGLHHTLSHLSFVYIIHVASFSQLNQVSTSSLCFYALLLLLFLYFPRLANPIRKQSRGRCLVITTSPFGYMEEDQLPKKTYWQPCFKASGTLLPSSTLPHRVEREEREEDQRSKRHRSKGLIDLQ